MRIFLLVAAILSAVCSFSQVKDDFSDGDFTNNPVWTGDSGKFVIDKNKMLRLNDTGKAESYAVLSTPSALVRGGTWEVYVHLLFNPSGRNYARFYLASSQADLSGALQGYFIEIGGEKDAVSLYRQDGEMGQLLLEGRLLMAKETSPELKIKVHCSEQGEWKVRTQLLKRETDYASEGTVVDDTYVESSFTGVVCVYTASRWNSFAFDDFLIKQEDGEITDPSDKPDEPQKPTQPDNPPEPGKPDDSLNPEQPDDSGKPEDPSKPEKPDNPSKPDEPEGPQVEVQSTPLSCVVFNEIMANPKGVAALPPVEYIELYNRQGVSVRLKGWKLHYGNRAYELPDVSILPHGYAVLCPEKDVPLWIGYPVMPAGMPSFPQLSNTGKLLYLENSRKELVAWVDYSDQWYADSAQQAGGYALECKDADNLTGCAENWSGSEDKRGGTPGETNSVAAPFADETVAEVFYYYLESPDTLVVRFTKPMNLHTLSSAGNYVFERKGRKTQAALPDYPAGRSVRLAFSPALVREESCEMELTGLLDISGNDCQGNLILNLALPQTAEKGDLALNEILFHPRQDGEDYAELYNLSGKQIPLNTLFFSSRTAEGKLQKLFPLAADGRPFLPHTYLCFTKNKQTVCDTYTACPESVIEITPLPPLPDDKGNILLVDSAGTILDELAYSEKMHTALLKDKEGVALEKSHPSLPSSVSSHWHSASSASADGTPGCQNSQYRELSAISENEFRLEESSFSPDGDGIKDELYITYDFSGEDFLANCRIYDASGREVCVLAQDYRLGAEGQLSWNGKNTAGRTVPAGLYILYIEAFNPKGEIRHFKLPCAVTK